VHYVLEGSSLGARVLRRQAAALGMSAGHGARHLWAQTAAPENWRAFVEALNAHAGEESALIAGANAGFDAAAASMERAAYA
jgi:heme oxygenase